jgi:hypothetical protein
MEHLMVDAGYTFLREQLKLVVPPLSLELKQSDAINEKTIDYGYSRVKILSSRINIGNTLCDHISTAIKYQGLNLCYLYAIFKDIDTAELTSYIQEKHLGETRRCIWYLYEWLMEERLDIPDLKTVRYVKLLRDQHYYTSTNSIRDKRTAIDNNLIGTKEFCPVIRKTPEILAWSEKDMVELAREELRLLGSVVNIELIDRSVNYLYTKETKSSTEIENEDSSEPKTVKFFRALKACGIYPLSKQRLIKVQNQIIQTPIKDIDYRDFDNYVGEKNQRTLTETVHYVCPRHEHVSSIMNGLLKMHDNLLMDNSLPPMMHAALISFGLVYVHPFSDGNGRTHRYLIHDILKARSNSRDNLIIPVSAAILQNMSQYDEVLESVSNPILDNCDFDLNNNGEIIIHNDIHYFYRFPDFTPHVDFLYKMMSAAITKDLLPEIILLYIHDMVKIMINDNYDLPDKQLGLLTNILLMNDGTLGKKKKKHGLFETWLSLDQINNIEMNATKIIRGLKDQFKHVLDAENEDTKA